MRPPRWSGSEALVLPSSPVMRPHGHVSPGAAFPQEPRRGKVEEAGSELEKRLRGLGLAGKASCSWTLTLSRTSREESCCFFKYTQSPERTGRGRGVLRKRKKPF